MFESVFMYNLGCFSYPAFQINWWTKLVNQNWSTTK